MNNFSNLSQMSDNTSYQIDLEQTLDRTKKTRNVRVIHCGDGVLEECSEDEEEKERQEEEENRKREELQRKLDLEAKNMSWMPWMGYMAQKGASKSLEVCDKVGEKLAWWLGITKPKFLYEIEEYNRMKQEEEDGDDVAEEIVIGTIEKRVEATDAHESEANFL